MNESKSMVILIVIFVASSIGLWPTILSAADLAFPTTEEGIVQALSLKDGKITHKGNEYISENGQVYKIIGAKRYKLRGLQAIVDSEIVPKAGALINFDFDSARIRPNSYHLLDEFGKALNAGLSTAVVIIAGHTDNIGTFDYNISLSQNRAKSVANYLITRHKIDSHRLVIKTYGESKPIASNEVEQGRIINRRVEFIRVE